MSIEYLSADWLREARRAVSESERLRELGADNAVSLTQVVTEAPTQLATEYSTDGTITYHITVDASGPSFGPGPATDEAIRFTQSYADAVRLARGDINAQELLIDGRLQFVGDHQALLDSTDIVGAIEDALQPVRNRTTYPTSS